MIWRNWYYKPANSWWGYEYHGMRDIDETEAAMQVLAGLPWEDRPCVKAYPDDLARYCCKSDCTICGGAGTFRLFKLTTNGEPYNPLGRR